ncbi:MAG TPA: ABC transporter ATP-binding protein [Mucilaginibacter sp.]|nr:ABC transporter ATP-binding protein [Mucilaginibacter sp.]
MSETPFLQAISLSKIFPGADRPGVKKTDLIIEPGVVTAIIGSSGSGKSTLLRLLYGLVSPDEGQVRFKGEKVWGPEVKLIPGHDAMKMVTQDNGDLNTFAKVWDNVASLMPNTNVKEKEERTEKVLKQLNILKLADKRVADLSGGERQRVAIARALITHPEVLLLDEPFNQVDTTFRDGLQEDIRQIVKDTGLTVVMVSHDPAEVLSMAYVLIVLQDGEIVEMGNPKKIYNDPKTLYTAQLLTNCNIFTTEEALLCGIRAHKQHVMIYPEWVTIASRWGRKNWTVKQVLFKGFYEELLLENGGIPMRILNGEAGKYMDGDRVNLKIGRYLEY